MQVAENDRLIRLEDRLLDSNLHIPDL